MSPEVAMRFEPSPLATAREDGSDARRDRAEAAGYAAGWAAGSRAAAAHATELRAQLAAEAAEAQTVRAAEHAALVAALERVCEGAAARTAPVLAASQHTLQVAALELAETLIGVELSDGEVSARAALSRALAMPMDVGRQTVRVHPDDARRIHAAVAAGDVALPSGLEVVADARIAAGDAVSEHDGGYLDARIGTAVARAREVLTGDAPTGEAS